MCVPCKVLRSNLNKPAVGYADGCNALEPSLSFREAEKQETRLLDTFRVRVTVRSSAARIINLHWREGMHDCCLLCTVRGVVEVELRLSPWKTDSLPHSEEIPRILWVQTILNSTTLFLSLAKADKNVTWRTDIYSNTRSFERYGKYNLSPTSSLLSVYLPPFPDHSCTDSHPLSDLSSFTSLSFLPLLHRHLSQSRYIIPFLTLFLLYSCCIPFICPLYHLPLIETSVHLGLCDGDRNSFFIFFLCL